MDYTAIVGASVYERGGNWLLALETSTGDVVEVIPTEWDGIGGFDGSGLNFVAALLNARGLVYRSWMEQDGRYVAVMHQRPTWGPR